MGRREGSERALQVDEVVHPGKMGERGEELAEWCVGPRWSFAHQALVWRQTVPPRGLAWRLAHPSTACWSDGVEWAAGRPRDRQRGGPSARQGRRNGVPQSAPARRPIARCVAAPRRHQVVWRSRLTHRANHCSSLYPPMQTATRRVEAQSAEHGGAIITFPLACQEHGHQQATVPFLGQHGDVSRELP